MALWSAGVSLLGAGLGIGAQAASGLTPAPGAMTGALLRVGSGWLALLIGCAALTGARRCSR